MGPIRIYVNHPDLGSEKRSKWKQAKRRFDLIAKARNGKPYSVCLPGLGFFFFDGKRFLGKSVAGIGYVFANEIDALEFSKRLSSVQDARVKWGTGWIDAESPQRWHSPQNIVESIKSLLKTP